MYIIKSFLPDFSSPQVNSSSVVQQIMGKIAQVRSDLSKDKIDEHTANQLISKYQTELQAAKAGVAQGVAIQKEADFRIDNFEQAKKNSSKDNRVQNSDNSELNDLMMYQIGVNNRIKLELI